MREFEGHPGAIFCAGAATCVRLALESIIENDGKPPSVLSQEYWKTLAHVGECLMFWCIGGKRYFHEIPAESIISDRKMRSRAVARKAVLAGLAGDDIDNWGIAIAKRAVDAQCLVANGNGESIHDGCCLWCLVPYISSH